MEKEITLVLSYLDKVAEKLGIGANMLWPYLMKQQLLAGYMSIFLMFFFSASAYFFWKSYRNDPERHEDKWSDTMYLKFWTTIILAVASIGAFARLVFVGFFQIFNTEYMAFKAILNLIEPVTR